jgi:hypothetical protein
MNNNPVGRLPSTNQRINEAKQYHLPVSSLLVAQPALMGLVGRGVTAIFPPVVNNLSPAKQINKGDLWPV